MLISQHNFIFDRLVCFELCCLSFGFAELRLDHRFYFEDSASACFNIPLCDFLVITVHSKFYHRVDVPLVACPDLACYVVCAN